MRCDRDRCRGCHSRCGPGRCDRWRQGCGHKTAPCWAKPRWQRWLQPISPESLGGSWKKSHSWLLLENEINANSLEVTDWHNQRLAKRQNLSLETCSSNVRNAELA